VGGKKTDERLQKVVDQLLVEGTDGKTPLRVIDSAEAKSVGDGGVSPAIVVVSSSWCDSFISALTPFILGGLLLLVCTACSLVRVPYIFNVYVFLFFWYLLFHTNFVIHYFIMYHIIKYRTIYYRFVKGHLLAFCITIRSHQLFLSYEDGVIYKNCTHVDCL